MRKALLVGVLLLLVSMGLGQRTLTDARLEGVRRIVNDTVAVELRGCWQHEGALRCAFAFSTAWTNLNPFLTLRTSDLTVTYLPTSAGSTTQAEPQTVRARMLTLAETADQGPKLDLSLEAMPTLVLADFPLPPGIKTLSAVRAGTFTFDAVPVAEKLPSEALLEASYPGPEALSFQMGQFRVEFVDIFRRDDYNAYNSAVLRFRVTNTGPESTFQADWGFRYYIPGAEIVPRLEWTCEGATPPKLLKDMSVMCHLWIRREGSYDEFKNRLPLLEISLNKQKRLFRNVYLNRFLR
ncbi:MAG: hypothetical protein ABWJ63_11205 [Thermus sp.]|uniref:hypothetical protein n=1 Tax=Thermus sp. TaxID=275 RepID=UPI00351AC878